MQQGESSGFVHRVLFEAMTSLARGTGVVLQSDALLTLSTVIIAPTSTRALPASFRPEVEIDGSRTRVLVEQIGAMDPTRLGESHGLLARDELHDVDRALAIVLGLTTGG